MLTVNDLFPYLVGIAFISFGLIGIVIWFMIELESYINKRVDELEKRIDDDRSKNTLERF